MLAQRSHALLKERLQRMPRDDVERRLLRASCVTKPATVVRLAQI
jgi:hypothetical protein